MNPASRASLRINSPPIDLRSGRKEGAQRLKHLKSFRPTLSERWQDLNLLRQLCSTLKNHAGQHRMRTQFYEVSDAGIEHSPHGLGETDGLADVSPPVGSIEVLFRSLRARHGRIDGN